MAQVGLGDRAGGSAEIRRAPALYDGLPSRSGEEWFETACCHAALTAPAGRDGSGVPAAAAASDAETAMALLAKAVTMGDRNRDDYKTESALDPLRQRGRLPAPDDGPGLSGAAVCGVRAFGM